MKNKIVFLVIFGLIFSSILGCDQLKSIGAKKEVKVMPAPSVIRARGAIVAKVNNLSVGLDDLNDEIDLYNANVPADQLAAKITTKEQKIAYLRNEIVRKLLIYQNALDKGLDRNEEVRQAVEKNKLDILVMENVKEVTKNVDVSSKEVEDYYNTYKDQLKEPEERQISEIVVGSEREAKDILIQLLQGVDFATLATNASKSTSAKAGGNLGFIQKGAKSPQFESVAFADTLNVGEVSSIFKTPDGYSVVKFVAKRGGTLKPLSEMWDDIKRGLAYMKQQQAIEDLIGKLSRDAKIEIYEGEMK